jgi:hypothetical protein
LGATDIELALLFLAALPGLVLKFSHSVSFSYKQELRCEFEK